MAGTCTHMLCTNVHTHTTQVGGRFSYLLKQGALNERDIVIGHLAVERARGALSPLAPWIDVLPKE